MQMNIRKLSLAIIATIILSSCKEEATQNKHFEELSQSELIIKIELIK
jgi:hypothetical protein